MCADLSVLRFKKSEREKNEILKKERSSLPCERAAVQVYSA